MYYTFLIVQYNKFIYVRVVVHYLKLFKRFITLVQVVRFFRKHRNFSESLEAYNKIIKLRINSF